MNEPSYYTWRSIGGALTGAYTRSLVTGQRETVVEIVGAGPTFGLLVPAMPTQDFTTKAEVKAVA